MSRAEKYFVEASFNLSTLGVDLECPSTGFASAFLRSQSSQENANPELKDYTTGPVNVPSNCSQFKIEKRKGTVDGELLPGATFAITPNPFPGQTQPDPAIVTDGGAGDADGTANGTVLINPAKPGTYTVSEETAPVGYIKETGTKQVAAQAYARPRPCSSSPTTWARLSGRSATRPAALSSAAPPSTSRASPVRP